MRYAAFVSVVVGSMSCASKPPVDAVEVARAVLSRGKEARSEWIAAGRPVFGYSAWAPNDLFSPADRFSSVTEVRVGRADGGDFYFARLWDGPRLGEAWTECDPARREAHGLRIEGVEHACAQRLSDGWLIQVEREGLVVALHWDERMSHPVRSDVLVSLANRWGPVVESVVPRILDSLSAGASQEVEALADSAGVDAVSVSRFTGRPYAFGVLDGTRGELYRWSRRTHWAKPGSLAGVVRVGRFVVKCHRWADERFVQVTLTTCRGGYRLDFVVNENI